MNSENIGYSKDRFINLPGESFDCIICSQVALKPKECSNCASMFCSACVDNWNKKRGYSLFIFILPRFIHNNALFSKLCS